MMSEIPGVGADAPTVVNEQGGAQSAAIGRFDMIPGEAIIRAAQVFQYGAVRYARNNWRRIPMSDHLNHLEQHLQAYKAGDRSDDHLGHLLARALMAVAMEDPSYDFHAIEELKPKG